MLCLRRIPAKIHHEWVVLTACTSNFKNGQRN
jgi:hypothetical protein